MSFLSDNKILFGAVGLAVSSAAVGYVLGRRSERLNSSSREYLVKVTRPVGPLANYIMDHGIREPTTLTSLRQVRSYTVKLLPRDTLWIQKVGNSCWAIFVPLY